MAIKGKKRSRGGRSRTGVAPRPKLVVPKKPFFRRTWVRVTLVVLLVLVVSGITFGVIVARRSAAEREAAQQEVTRVGEQLEEALRPVAQVSGSSMLLLPDLDPTIIEIQGGAARPRRVERLTVGWEEDLGAAIEDLGAIETDRGDLRRAVERIGDGMEMYAVLIQGIRPLLELETQPEVEEAVLALQPELQVAAGTVQSGYLIYLSERVEVGLDEGTPGFDTQLPGTNPFDLPEPGEVPVPAPTG